MTAPVPRGTDLGLIILGVVATICVAGVLVMVLAPTTDTQTDSAVTALSSVASTAIGALAAWLRGGRTDQTPDNTTGRPPEVTDPPNNPTD